MFSCYARVIPMLLAKSNGTAVAEGPFLGQKEKRRGKEPRLREKM